MGVAVGQHPAEARSAFDDIICTRPAVTKSDVSGKNSSGDELKPFPSAESLLRVVEAPKGQK